MLSFEINRKKADYPNNVCLSHKIAVGKYQLLKCNAYAEINCVILLLVFTMQRYIFINTLLVARYLAVLLSLLSSAKVLALDSEVYGSLRLGVEAVDPDNDPGNLGWLLWFS